MNYRYHEIFYHENNTGWISPSIIEELLSQYLLLMVVNSDRGCCPDENRVFDVFMTDTWRLIDTATLDASAMLGSQRIFFIDVHNLRTNKNI